jgi:hypothetical protein
MLLEGFEYPSRVGNVEVRKAANAVQVRRLRRVALPRLHRANTPGQRVLGFRGLAPMVRERAALDLPAHRLVELGEDPDGFGIVGG